LLAQDSSWQITPDIWQQSEEEILRLPPSSFRELPREVIEDLQNRRCAIPQAVPGSSGHSNPHNVIRGEFVKKGQTDWAILCSRKKPDSPYDLYAQDRHYTIQRSWASSVVVYFGGTTANVSETGERYDMNDQVGMVELENGQYVYRRLGYTRLLRAVDEEYILERNDPATQYRPPTPASRPDTEITVAADVLSPIDHQGIDDPFQEKASTVHYFHEGEWITLAGDD
jgi:hypothetical protein